MNAGSGDENARLGGWRDALRQSVKRIRPSEDPLTGRNKSKVESVGKDE